MKRQLIAGLSVISFSLPAQDALYLNPNQSLISLNPSFAGSNGGVRNQFSYRNQYPNLSGASIRLTNSFDCYLPWRGGLALSYQYEDDLRGTRQVKTGSIAYAHHFMLFDDRLKVSPSAQLTYGRMRLDLRSMPFGFHVGPPINYNSWVERKYFASIGSGLVMAWKKDFTLGAYIFHLNRPDVGHFGEERLPQRYVAHAAYTFHYGEKSLLQFSARLNNQGGDSFFQLMANAVIGGRVMVGAGYANEDLVNVSLGYRWNRFCFLYGYDVTFSRLSGNTAGSHELHISFNLRKLRSGLANFENF